MSNDPNISAPLSPSFEDLETPRLQLAPISVQSLQCQLNNSSGMRSELGRILRATVPDSWPHENWEPHVFEYLLDLIAVDPDAMAWCRYVMLRGSAGRPRTLIGTVGCGFPKPETGEAEFGYGILPEFQRKGYATEAVAALLPWLRAQRPVKVFVAQTFPHLSASIRVLEKSGFVHAGPGFEEGAILFREAASPD